MKKKKILFITGTRADFSKIILLIQSFNRDKFEILVFATGMHMLKKYGLTINEVRKLKKSSIYEFTNQKEGDSQVEILSKTVLSLEDFITEHKPDLMIVHGDRVEALSGVIVSATNNLNCCHIEGGEVSGTLDEMYRHASSKFSTTHLVSSNDAKKRLIKLGENPKNIFVIGSPELDYHKSSNISLDKMKNHYKINFDEYGVFMFHPSYFEISKYKSFLKILFDELVNLNKNFIIFLPNNDPGSELIFDQIKKLKSKNFKVIPSMRFEYFSALLKNSSIVIGNSSVIVRECPFLGIPSILVGDRQNNRSNAKSIKKIKIDDAKLLSKIVLQNWNKKFNCNKNFGDGNSVSKFKKLIKSNKLFPKHIRKSFYE